LKTFPIWPISSWIRRISSIENSIYLQKVMMSPFMSWELFIRKASIWPSVTLKETIMFSFGNSYPNASPSSYGWLSSKTFWKLLFLKPQIMESRKRMTNLRANLRPIFCPSSTSRPFKIILYNKRNHRLCSMKKYWIFFQSFTF
jgi:hypothetical protein